MLCDCVKCSAFIISNGEVLYKNDLLIIINIITCYCWYCMIVSICSRCSSHRWGQGLHARFTSWHSVSLVLPTGDPSLLAKLCVHIAEGIYHVPLHFLHQPDINRTMSCLCLLKIFVVLKIFKTIYALLFLYQQSSNFITASTTVVGVLDQNWTKSSHSKHWRNYYHGNLWTCVCKLLGVISENYWEWCEPVDMNMFKKELCWSCSDYRQLLWRWSTFAY